MVMFWWIIFRDSDFIEMVDLQDEEIVERELLIKKQNKMYQNYYKKII